MEQIDHIHVLLNDNVLHNPLISDGRSAAQVNQSARYVHSCLALVMMIIMNTNSPSQNSVVLESDSSVSSAAKTCFDRRFNNH